MSLRTILSFRSKRALIASVLASLGTRSGKGDSSIKWYPLVFETSLRLGKATNSSRSSKRLVRVESLKAQSLLSFQAEKIRVTSIEAIDVLKAFFQLMDQRAREFLPILENTLFSFFKDTRFEGVNALIGEKECQIGEGAILTDQVTGTLLGLTKVKATFYEIKK